MLRHGCGYKLANDGQDTRSIQHYLGHRSVASTVRYTALAPDRLNISALRAAHRRSVKRRLSRMRRTS
jgi:site-specific recombinase XerD